VHGRRLLIAWVKRSAQRLKQFAWVRRVWKPLDVVADSKEGGISFDLSVEDGQRYRVVAGGWTKEPCAICGWELSAEGGPERSEAFTNGREWLCLECYHKFVAKEGAEVA
jgi:rubredoxin